MRMINALIVVVFAGAAVWYVYTGMHSPSGTFVKLNASDFSWEVAPDGGGTPQPVGLAVRGMTFQLGSYAGCASEPITENLEPNEVSRLRCWYAGAGDELGVFEESGMYVVKHRWTQEVPPDTKADSEGPFETLMSLSVPS